MTKKRPPGNLPDGPTQRACQIPLRSRGIKNSFLVSERCFADLANLYFLAINFLFVKNFYVFASANRANPSAALRQLSHALSSMRFGHIILRPYSALGSAVAGLSEATTLFFSDAPVLFADAFSARPRFSAFSALSLAFFAAFFLSWAAVLSTGL